MRSVLGWTAIAGAVLAFIAGIRCSDRARWGPYWDVLKGMAAGPPPDVPRSWKWTWLGIGTAFWLLAWGLLVLAAYLLPDFEWLRPFRLGAG